MQNRRLTARRTMLLGARIVSSDRATSMECVLRNLSPDGAKLALADAARVPPRFELHVPHLKRRFHASTAWHGSNEVGIRLTPAKDAADDAPTGLVSRVRRLEAEKRALQQRVLELTGG
jgi:hypothetical protein